MRTNWKRFADHNWFLFSHNAILIVSLFNELGLERIVQIPSRQHVNMWGGTADKLCKINVQKCMIIELLS